MDLQSLNQIEIPKDLEERLRASAYPSRDDMPFEVRREHKISFYMGMMPKGTGWTREDVERMVDATKV